MAGKKKPKRFLLKQLIMRRVLVALLPCVAGAVYFFGWRSLALILWAGGFMGQDARSVTEVIDTDAGTLFELGVTARQIADRMKEITDTAAQALGTWTEIDARHQAMVDEVRGVLPCPWPHPGNYFKRVTTLRHSDSGKTLHWSDLNIHMIAAHGFFEGHGSAFRTAPAELADALF